MPGKYLPERGAPDRFLDEPEVQKRFAERHIQGRKGDEAMNDIRPERADPPEDPEPCHQPEPAEDSDLRQDLTDLLIVNLVPAEDKLAFASFQKAPPDEFHELPFFASAVEIIDQKQEPHPQSECLKIPE
jgi:hypothetical protein